MQLMEKNNEEIEPNNALQLTIKSVAPVVAMLLGSTEFSRYG